jgi:hypothetical protein
MGFAWCAFIISAPDEEVLNRAREVDSSCKSLPGGFVRMEWDSWPDWSVSGSTTSLSSQFGEAWLLVGENSSGVFACEHGKNGQILRSLAYTGDEGWILVEGNPEEWESVLFSDKGLSFARDMIRDEPDKPKWVEELADLEAGRLKVGNMLPVADATLIQLIARKIGTEIVL